MAALARTGAGNIATGNAATGTSLLLNKPTNAATGTVCIAAVWSRAGTAAYTAPPAGWFYLAQSAPATVGWQGFYGKVMAAGEPVSWSWAGGGSGRHVGVVFIVDGANAADIYAGSGASATATDLGTTWQIVAPTFTPADTNDLLLALVGVNTTGNAPTDFTPPSGMTTVASVHTATGASDSTIHVAQQQLTSGAATGTRSFVTIGDAASGQGFLMALRSSAGNAPPTVSAGADQTGIEPYATVTHTGTDADSDGTIASRLWTQTAGPAVALLGAATGTVSYEAPGSVAGTTVTLSYTVTDNLGATATDSVSDTILPVLERAVVGGIEVPMRIRTS